MLCETHKLIANRIYDALGEDCRKFIDLDSLLDGSVAPDNLPSMAIIPHVKKKSTGFFNKQLNGLLNGSSIENYNPFNFSYKLGIIIHLVSDYFCTAHNHMKYLNPLLHFYYERKLKNYFKKNVYLLTIKDIFEGSTFTMENIQKFIDEKHEQYKALNEKQEYDFIYSIEVSMYVSQAILGIYSMKLNNRAA